MIFKGMCPDHTNFPIFFSFFLVTHKRNWDCKFLSNILKLLLKYKIGAFSQRKFLSAWRKWTKCPSEIEYASYMVWTKHFISIKKAATRGSENTSSLTFSMCVAAKHISGRHFQTTCSNFFSVLCILFYALWHNTNENISKMTRTSAAAPT